MVFLRPVGRAIAKRREYINSLVSDYDRYQAEARSLRAEAENVRAAARREAEHRRGRRARRGSNEAAEVVEHDTRSKRRRSSRRRSVRLQAELEAARAGEERRVRQLADLMVERVIPEAAS